MQELPFTLYRAEQIKAFERCAIQDHGIAGFELMSRAGADVFQCLQAQWPLAKTLAVFCGSGNNAGDGYVVAKLARDAGMNVCVFWLSEPEKLKGDALTAYQQYASIGGRITHFQNTQTVNADVIVDALLGTGLDREVAGLYAQAIEVINHHPAPVLAVDIPSGLNADTGNIMGVAVKANCTVTFIGLKQGLFTGLAADYGGKICFSSLSVPDAVFDKVSANCYRLEKKTWSPRRRCSHKGDFDHVLIVGGDFGYSGAVKLAAEAALRIGSGLVSIATRPEHAGLMNINRPELMAHGVTHPEQITDLLLKATVVVIGPGLGQSHWASELFTVISESGKPMVVDADALNILAKSPLQNPYWVLTPHPGEAGRLLNCSSANIQQDRFTAARAINARYGGISVLKGAGTLIASADDLSISNTGNPGMASGGMGDVLSGVIGGLIAQGWPLKEAAQQGVYLHGLAADLAADEGGERGLLASDLMPYLRHCVNS